MKRAIKQLCPPILWNSLATMKRRYLRIRKPKYHGLGVYWDPEFAKGLETWGEGNVWTEIQFFMVNCKGKILDIACGTGKTITILSDFPNVTVYGCDISDFLLQKAVERHGIPKERLKVCDATKMDYENNFFDYSYSIGSLEHFTEENILKCISETSRITKKSSFHLIPVSRSEKNEGWIKRTQEYYNNTFKWWLDKFNSVYKTVYILDSKWESDISIGKWFICNWKIE